MNIGIDLAVLSVLLISTIAEMVVSGSWQPFYFRAGVRLYRKSAPLTLTSGMSPVGFAKHFEEGMFPPIVFRQISPHEVAFREAIFHFSIFSYTPVMHGLIRSEPGRLEVTGRLNWVWMVLPAFFILNVFRYGEALVLVPLFAAVYGGVGAIMYAIQARRFRKVADFALAQGQTECRAAK